MTKELAKDVPAEYAWEAQFLAAIEALGTPEQRMERKRRSDATLQFILDHTEEWREEYPNHWIAVYGDKVVAAESSRKRLVNAVLGLGLDFSQVQTRFITEEARFFLL